MIINVIHDAAKRFLNLEGYSAYIYTGMWTSSNPDDLFGSAIKLWKSADKKSFVRECLIVLRNESSPELVVRYNTIVNGHSSISSSHPEPAVYRYDDPSFNIDEFLATMKTYLDR